MIKKLITLPYKTVSFDQFPMKSGMFPVSSLSDAHLRAPKILLENYMRTPFSHQDIVQQSQNVQTEGQENSYTIVRLCRLANVEGISPLTPELSK